jgi:hypothetical protein
MFALIAVGLAGLLLFWMSTKLAALNRNIAAAKSSGLPYRISSKMAVVITSSKISNLLSHRWGARLSVDSNPRHLSRHTSQVQTLTKLALAKVRPPYSYPFTKLIFLDLLMSIAPGITLKRCEKLLARSI